jgi:ATP/maltotriose-dependent transcriptional regulator MalT
MARLLGTSNAEVQARRLEVARSFATQHQCFLSAIFQNLQVSRRAQAVALYPRQFPG